MSDKKWYNLFVSVEGQEGSPGSPVSAQDAAAELERLARSTDPNRAAAAPPSPAPGAGRPASAASGAARLAGTPARRAPHTVADLAASLPDPKFQPTATHAASFDEIYTLADIRAPEHGYTIFKVGQMLTSEHLRGLPPKVKASSILVALEAAGVTVDQVVQDAVRRDRALDAYERAQQKSVEDLEARKIAENGQIQAELDRLIAQHEARMKANNDEVAREKERFYGWRLKKQQEEQKIAEAVGYFLSEQQPNPISTRPAAAAEGSEK